MAPQTLDGRTDEHTDFILCPIGYYALHWTDNTSTAI